MNYTYSFSGAKAGRRHAGFSSAAASKQARGAGSGEQARGAGAEYDGVSALQLNYPHEYIIYSSELEELSHASVLPLSLSCSILASAAAARNGRQTTSNWTFSIWWPFHM